MLTVVVVVCVSEVLHVEVVVDVAGVRGRVGGGGSDPWRLRGMGPGLHWGCQRIAPCVGLREASLLARRERRRWPWRSWWGSASFWRSESWPAGARVLEGVLWALHPEEAQRQVLQ